MKHPYVNAASVMPKELLQKVREYCVGMVYIPKTDGYYKQRAELIVRLSEQGVSTLEIAQLSGLSRRRVQQIIQEQQEAQAKKSKKISLETPEFPW